MYHYIDQWREKKGQTNSTRSALRVISSHVSEFNQMFLISDQKERRIRKETKKASKNTS